MAYRDYRQTVQIQRVNELLTHASAGIVIRRLSSRNGINAATIETNDYAEKGKVDRLVRLFDDSEGDM